MTVYVLIKMICDDPGAVTVKVFNHIDDAITAQWQVTAEIGDSNKYLTLIQTCEVK